MKNLQMSELTIEDIKGIFNDHSYKKCTESFYSKKTIYGFAEKAHEQVANISPEGFSLEQFLHAIGAKIKYFDMDAFGEISGSIIVRGEKDIHILLPNYTTEVRNRFTIAHELGHYVLHCPDVNKRVKYAYNRSGANQRVETESNWFARGLLVPMSKLKEFIDKGKSDLHPYDVAMEFGVSGKSAEIRINTNVMSKVQHPTNCP